MPNGDTVLLKRSGRLATWLAENVSDRDLPATLKNSAAAGCFAVVQDHHGAIVYLIDQNHPSPAFSLARSVYEGYIRGSWLLQCASDPQVESFIAAKRIQAGNGRKMEISDLIEALETKPVYDAGDLLAIKDNAWIVLCDYAHVGGRLVSQWNTGTAIEANFSPNHRDEVLRLTGSFAALAAIGMCEIYQDDDLAERVHEQFRLFHDIT